MHCTTNTMQCNEQTKKKNNMSADKQQNASKRKK